MVIVKAPAGGLLLREDSGEHIDGIAVIRISSSKKNAGIIYINGSDEMVDANTVSIDFKKVTNCLNVAFSGTREQLITQLVQNFQ